MSEKPSLIERYRQKLTETSKLEGFHISKLVYDCPRRLWFSMTEEPKFSNDTILKMNSGKLIHEGCRVPGVTHELELRWGELIATLDGYDEETGEIVDLKCVWTPGQYVKELPYAHHARQIEYYIFILTKLGRKVGTAAIFYLPFDIAKVIEPRPLEQIEAEIMGKLKIVKEAMSTGVPPIGFYNTRECRFCQLGRCQELGGWPEKKPKEAT